MSRLRGYHCNQCGAWLLVGEQHTCDPLRLDVIDRIADFFSQRQVVDDEQEKHDHLELAAQASARFISSADLPSATLPPGDDDGAE
jgi:hypothetical protein